MDEKKTQYGILIIVSLALIGGMSVIGILRDTEPENSSDIILQPPNPKYPTIPVPSPPLEPEIDIYVYSDADCTMPCTSITWGGIKLGDSINKTIYLMNSKDDAVYFSLTTQNWAPSEADGPLQLNWDYDYRGIVSGMVRSVTLTLSASSSISNIMTFDFDIVIATTI